jgi:hypothetical protein
MTVKSGGRGGALEESLVIEFLSIGRLRVSGLNFGLVGG